MLWVEFTAAQISAKFQVPPSVASRWKNELLDRGAAVFSDKQKETPAVWEAAIERLHASIGKLKLESDFLHKASAKLRL